MSYDSINNNASVLSWEIVSRTLARKRIALDEVAEEWALAPKAILSGNFVTVFQHCHIIKSETMSLNVKFSLHYFID